MSITEDYVSFEVAKLLKDKGFDECPLFRYDDCGQLWVKGGYNKTLKWHFPAPTLQMALKWLRIKHNIGIFPSTYCLLKDGKLTHPYGTCITDLVTYEIIVDDCLPAETYEEAIENALIYCLKNLI